ncbi:MAG: PEP-CTERM sorting domain-containing protein [Bryobacteraceae bacterium]
MKFSEKSPVKAVKKLARELLTTTCLTAVAAGVAQATPFNESTVVDFNNTFGTANDLPLGTDNVVGGLQTISDNDFFRFLGLAAGGAYTLTGSYELNASYSVLDSGGGVLNGPATNPPIFNGIVPGDGILVVGVNQQEQTAFYDLNLAAQSAEVPEPSTTAGVGLALAGALALRRKRTK